MKNSGDIIRLCPKKNTRKVKDSIDNNITICDNIDNHGNPCLEERDAAQNCIPVRLRFHYI
jgi:hypothetical protein